MKADSINAHIINFVCNVSKTHSSNTHNAVIRNIMQSYRWISLSQYELAVGAGEHDATNST